MATEIHEDEVGRCFCKLHKRARCHECCYDFELVNELAEERAGLREPRTRAENLAREIVEAQISIAAAREMGTWDEELHGKNCVNALEKNTKELRRLVAAKEATEEEIATAMRKRREDFDKNDAEMRAVYQAWKQENPDKTTMEWGGEDTQRLFDAVAAPPPSADSDAVDKRTCGWCGTSSGAKKLAFCGKCRKVSYCGRDCQRAAWKGHKKVCRASEDDKKEEKKKEALPLTWDQLEAHGLGVEATGKMLELRVMEDRSITRPVFACKDRMGAVKIIAAYTDNRDISGLAPGKVLRWKNPRFHFFIDGSSGGRIEQEDLENLEIV